TGSVMFRVGNDVNLHFGSYTGNVVTIEAFNDGNTLKRDIMLAGFGGGVGIGTSTPQQKLQVQGNIRVGTSGSNGCIQGFGGATLTGTCASDSTLKTDIHDLGDALTSIGNIDFVTYK